MINKYLISIFVFFLVSASSFAQTGTLSGIVTEQGSTLEVIGGNVIIEGTATGTITEFDGTYVLELDPGTYNIEYSYIGFQNFIAQNVMIKSGETTTLNVTLEEESVELESVVVTAKAYRNTEASVLALRKSSTILLDGISSAQFKKSGDSDVAQAVKRVTGVTLEGGKYVYIRGLGDRYSKTTLNGAEIPGLDPNRNTVQVDLFPTSLVDNIVVYKTFSPELPGDWTGGLVDINTKDYPESYTVSASISTGYNATSNLNNNFLSYEGGSTDALGFDDGTREIPTSIENQTGVLTDYAEGLNNSAAATEVANNTNAFSNNWSMEQAARPLDLGASFSIGNLYDIKGKSLGISASATYARNYSGYQNGQVGIYQLSGDFATTNLLNPQILLTDSEGNEETTWGALLAASLQIDEYNTISFTGMHNQSGTSTAKYAFGTKNADDPDDIFQTRSWRYLERSLSTLQTKGTHNLGKDNRIKLTWISSYSISRQDDPDLRFFTNRINTITNNAFLKPSSDNVPTRFYRNMVQNNSDTRVSLEIPFKQWNGFEGSVQFGGAFNYKDRTFTEDRYNFNNNSSSISVPNPEDILEQSLLDLSFYFAENNLVSAGANGYNNNGSGVYVTDNFDARNNYNASATTTAAFAKTNLALTDKLKAIVGLRVERTFVGLETFDTGATLDNFPDLDGAQNLLDNTDFLPSATFNYTLSENQKLRLSYSRTVARPTFRELAPFASFALDGGFVFVGNPDLKRTSIDNLDLRWELYPNSGESLSAGVFAKNFTNPIERTFNPEAQNTELTYRNVDQARLVGVELEFRKKLETIASFLRGFDWSTNLTYIYSETDIDEEELEQIRISQPDASSTRAVFGQAPYVFNTTLSYGSQKGTKASISFNVIGDAISVVTRGATPNYFVKSQPLLNFRISQKLNDYFTLTAGASNILNSEYAEVATFKGQENSIQSYKPGVDYSLSLGYKFSKN